MKKELLLFLTSNYPKFRINNDLINNTYNLFNDVKLLDENDLDKNILNIINEIKSKYGERGYGYWIWKPYIIWQELNKLNEGDILVHLNIHCKLDFVKNNNIFNKILYELNNQSIILGISGNNDYMYTTTKLRKHIETQLNYKFTNEELNECQIDSGMQFIKNCEFSRNFIKTWFDLMLSNLDYVSDMHNDDNDNHETFVENRHDQSVLSLLYKYYKLKYYKDITWDNFHK